MVTPGDRESGKGETGIEDEEVQIMTYKTKELRGYVVQGIVSVL